jgi:phosphate/sulfate permease
MHHGYPDSQSQAIVGVEAESGMENPLGSVLPLKVQFSASRILWSLSYFFSPILALFVGVWIAPSIHFSLLQCSLKL